MLLHYTPLLQIQRDLHSIPRGMERFKQYLRTIFGSDEGCLALPSLITMNPMGKEHVAILLDELLALRADEMAARTCSELQRELSGDPGDYKIAMVIADDLLGGWTNRYDYEFNIRFPQAARSTASTELPRWLKHYWLTAVLWSSEPVLETTIRETIRSTIYRTIYLRHHGTPKSLRDLMKQEGEVMARAGCTRPMIEPDDIAYTREVIRPVLEASDKRTIIEYLFGDPAGNTLGFTPRGLSLNAGLALALHDALNNTGTHLAASSC